MEDEETLDLEGEEWIDNLLGEIGVPGFEPIDVSGYSLYNEPNSVMGGFGGWPSELPNFGPGPTLGPPDDSFWGTPSPISSPGQITMTVPSGPTAPSGNNYGDPGGDAETRRLQQVAAEQARHNNRMEQLRLQEIQLGEKLNQAKIAALNGDPAAQAAVGQLQQQMDALDAEKAALAREQLASENSYREGLLANEAAKLGLSQEELAANLALSREKLAAQIDQFNKTYGLDWMKNAQAVEQFNQRLGFDYWSSGNDLLFNTWQTQMQQAAVERGQNLDYNLGLMGNQTNQRGQDLSYNLGAGRLNLDAQGQMFDQSMELSNLAANPRNLAQSLIMMGLSPSAARDFMGSTPLVSTWMNHSTDLDRMPYQSSVPFEYGDNDLPLSFLPAGNDMRGYGFLPPSMQMPYQNVTNGMPVGMLPTGPTGSIPPPNFNMTPPPGMSVPPMTPPGAGEQAPLVAAPKTGEGNTAPPMTTDPAPITVPSFADWAKTSGYSYKDGSYKPRSPTGSSVIPNRGLDPYYGSSTRKQGK